MKVASPVLKGRVGTRVLARPRPNTSPIRKLIREWLKAGVMDRKIFQPTEAGTPQEGVISPLLANIALHGLEAAVREIIPKTISEQKKTSSSEIRG